MCKDLTSVLHPVTLFSVLDFSKKSIYYLCYKWSILRRVTSSDFRCVVIIKYLPNDFPEYDVFKYETNIDKVPRYSIIH